MNRLRDFIYDKSDILVALIIISVAGVIIFSRIDAILAYPETYAKEAAPVVESEEPVQYEYPDPSTAENPGTPSGDAIEPGEGEPEMFAVYINYGESLQVIARKFVDVGLFETTEDFFTAVDAANAGTQIKTGNFIIPSDSTPEEVMAIITKPGL